MSRRTDLTPGDALLLLVTIIGWGLAILVCIAVALLVAVAVPWSLFAAGNAIGALGVIGALGFAIAWIWSALRPRRTR